MLADTETISFLDQLFGLPNNKPVRSTYEVMEEKRQRIMDEAWQKQGRLGNIREYVHACTLRFDKELNERYDERDDEHLDDDDVIDNCFSCGREITAGMMRSVDAISYSWTHKDGTPVTAKCCWGNPECQNGEFKPEEGRPIVSTSNPSHYESWLHHHYLRLCGLTEKEYREQLKREQPTVYENRVKAGWYKDLV